MTNKKRCDALEKTFNIFWNELQNISSENSFACKSYF